MHGPEQFLVELFAIFVAAKVLGEVFERLRLPGVLGEILAGVGLGPYALNWIAPSDTIYSVAEVGAIFVLFSAGLETSPQALIRVGRKSLLVAVAGVVAPFILGFAYMKPSRIDSLPPTSAAAGSPARASFPNSRLVNDIDTLLH